MSKRKCNGIYNYQYKGSDEDENEDDGSVPNLTKLFSGSIFRRPDDDEHHGKMNHIYFYDEINRDTAFYLSKKLRATALKLQEIALKYDLEQSPKIYLHINSLGGCVFSSFTVVDTILQSPVPVVTIVEGAVASAGTIISIAGHERQMSEYGYFLMHQISSGAWGKMVELEDAMDNWEEIMRRIRQHYLRFSGGKCNNNIIDEILKHDIWWTAKDCLELNLVDKVVTGNPDQIGNCINVMKQKQPTKRQKSSKV